MAVVYSGGTYISTTFLGDTIAAIITAIQAQLTNAGWTVISGGGTTNVLMQSATQAGVTNPIRVRIKTNAGTSATVSLENQAGTLTSTSSTGAGGSLLPAASQTMRIIATKYWFACFVPGSAVCRKFVYAGMPYVDATIVSGVTDIGLFSCDSINDSDTSARGSFRSSPSFFITGNGNGNYACIYNASLLQSNGSGSNDGGATAGGPETLITCQPGRSQTSTPRAYRWANDALVTSDVLVCWGLTATTDEAKIRGQFFDMAYIADAVAMDATDTFSGHTWYNLTNNFSQTNGVGPRGGMWVRTDT